MSSGDPARGMTIWMHDIKLRKETPYDFELITICDRMQIHHDADAKATPFEAQHAMTFILHAEMAFTKVFHSRN
jgi:hypothetical protein